LKRLREEHWSALYGLGTRFGVSWLSQEDARRLVTEPVQGQLTYSPAAIERMISQTAGQPYLLQCVCNRIFDMAAQSRTRSVTSDLVDQAITAFVEDNEHFASLWDYAGSDRRRFLLALCHRAGEGTQPSWGRTGPGQGVVTPRHPAQGRPGQGVVFARHVSDQGGEPFRLEAIQEQLAAHGIEVDDETVITDLEFLRELELIELVGEPSGGHYRLAIPLMGPWIERQQDFDAVRMKAISETEDEHV
jgi:type I restriction enzyme M protein